MDVSAEDVRKALKEWQIALEMYNYVYDDSLDFMAYHIKACQEKYEVLLREYKKQWCKSKAG